MAQQAWVLRQFDPNFFSLKLGPEEIWIHFLRFSGKRQQVDREVFRHLDGSELALPRKNLAGMDCFVLPPQKLAFFHPPLPGRKLDFGAPQDCEDAVRFLAAFHLAGQDFSCAPLPHVTLGRETELWEKRLRRLHEFARIAKGRLFPGSIDRAFLERFTVLDRQIGNGLQKLKDSSYEALCARGGQLCYYHFRPEFFWRWEGRLAPWHFAFCHWDLPVVDLYRLLAKIYRKHEQSGLLFRLIELYRATRPIGREEIKILQALISLPDKMYRTVAAFYLNRSAKSPRRQLARIEKEAALTEERLRLAGELGLLVND